MHKFKIGDRVRMRGVNGVIRTIDNLHPSGAYGLVEHSAAYYEYEMTLAEPETPQELADKYRSLTAEARVIRETLTEQGYTLEGNTSDDRGWLGVIPTTQWRFVKQEQVII